MSDKIISVIIPCHNYGIYLSEAINSIKNQSYTNWEILIIDDGSTDNTAVVAKQFAGNDARIKYFYQEKQGVSIARNKGFALSTGDYIQLLDADDYIGPDKFATQLATFAEFPDAALVYGDTYSFIHKPQATAREFQLFEMSMPPISGEGIELTLYLAHDNIFLISCPLFTRSMLQQIGGFNTTIVAFEDWEFWYKAALQGAKFVYDNRKGSEFYVRSHGSNTTGNRYKMWKHKIIARKSVIASIVAVGESKQYNAADLKKLLAKHKEYLYKEQARFSALYEGTGTALLNTLLYSLHGSEKSRIWYDTAYWFKERMLGRGKK